MILTELLEVLTFLLFFQVFGTVHVLDKSQSCF